MSGGGKEAVCFILDGNVSMKRKTKSNKSDDDDDDDVVPPSRFDVAKEVAIDFISSLMIRSRTHEYVHSV
jgi:hypothetical protein